MAIRKRQRPEESSVFNRFCDEFNKLRDIVLHIDKKLDLYAQRTNFELEKIRELDSRQNTILDEHQRRSTELQKNNELIERALRKDIGALDRRIDKLEEPRRFRAKLFRRIVVITSALTAISGLTYAILRLLG